MLDLRRLCQDMSDPRSPLRRETEGDVGRIAACLDRPSAQTAAALEGWREVFQMIYGGVSLSAHKRLDPETLLRSYSLDSGGEEAREGRMQKLVFAIQTYYSLLVKTVAAAVLGGNLRDPSGVIRGTSARERGVTNYCGDDPYCWPLHELDAGMDQVVSSIAELVSRYQAQDPAQNIPRDDLKRLYEALIPARLRHALGEYYTPDWLAEYTLHESLALSGQSIQKMRVADPACGSGAFLLQAIAQKRQTGCDTQEILSTIRGYDINPLAVLTARTNYLLSIPQLAEAKGPIELPVYQADTLLLGTDTAKADLVLGNPPWVNWEYLPPAYRERCLHLWKRYALVSAKGPALSFLKEDVSVLMTYVAADRLLADGGTLALVLRQGVFKSARNGAGFRRFRLPDGQGLQALRVEDLSRLKVFPGAAADAALLFARKGEKTVYPLPYALWEKTGRGPIDPCASLSQAMDRVSIQNQQATPASREDPSSPWLTAPAEELTDLARLLGNNPYRARTGVFTGGANAVYWLSVHSAQNGLARVSNITARAKRKAEEIETALETAYLYPLLKGGRIRRWQTSYDAYILCPHTAQTRQRPVPWEQLEAECPRTAAYLSSFRELLDRRKGFAGWERFIQRQQFHAVLRVGAYTFSPWKVVWKYIASEFVCAVVGTVEDPYLGSRPLLPNEKVVYVALESAEEAYYLCGVLSSTPVARCVKGYMRPTSISAHVLEKLRIPPYDPTDLLHREISRLCREGHGAEDVTAYIREIDRLMDDLYGQSFRPR